MSRTAALAVAIALNAATAWAAPPASPTPQGAGVGWPCESEPRPNLRLEDYWPGASAPPSAANWRDTPEVAALVQTTAPRSVPLDDAVARVRAFAAEAAPARVRSVAAGLVDSIDGERRVIIAGIRRFNHRQEDIARHIQQSYADLDKPAPPVADAAAVQARAGVEEQGRWFAKIFEDRQRMLPLMCRQPEVLEARLKALVAAARDAKTS